MAQPPTQLCEKLFTQQMGDPVGKDEIGRGEQRRKNEKHGQGDEQPSQDGDHLAAGGPGRGRQVVAADVYGDLKGVKERRSYGFDGRDQ